MQLSAKRTTAAYQCRRIERNSNFYILMPSVRQGFGGALTLALGGAGKGLAGARVRHTRPGRHQRGLPPRPHALPGRARQHAGAPAAGRAAPGPQHHVLDAVPLLQLAGGGGEGAQLARPAPTRPRHHGAHKSPKAALYSMHSLTDRSRNLGLGQWLRHQQGLVHVQSLTSCRRECLSPGSAHCGEVLGRLLNPVSFAGSARAGAGSQQARAGGSVQCTGYPRGGGRLGAHPAHEGSLLVALRV